MSKPIWLITGGAGFIGSNIAEILVNKGERVRIFDNLSATGGSKKHIKGFIDKVEFVKGDLRNPADVAKAVKGVTYISHQAAMRSVPKSVDAPTETNDNNVTGTLNLLVAAKKAGVKRIVYASSSSVYGDGNKFPQKESFIPGPLSPYAASKLAAEYYCVLWAKTYGLETVSLRYFNVFGPRQDPESKYSTVVPKFMERIKAGLPLEVDWDGKQSRDFTFVADVAQANIKAMTAKGVAGNVYNVACGKTHSMLKLIKIIEKIAGKKTELKFFPKRAGDVRKTYADISRAVKELKYKPQVSFEEGLKKTWAYFQ